ncbi:Ferulic acid decarboxylase 1 [Neonectria punicea]|uniref:Ferulic acid decarboxylase 1 n=1 Tax=Neonectria punicea TaxID=979145 RepID=A0ABR1GNH8_9HYPO
MASTVRAPVTRQDEIDAQLDFRKFIEVLGKDGDLAVIDEEIDPHLEVGAIVRRVSEVDGKAPLFNNIKGSKEGLWRMFGNAASLRATEGEKYGRIARNLGLPTNSTWKTILERTQAGKHLATLPPNLVPNGPCKQNKIFGDDIDLDALPAPLLHSGDGGKYLQTYGVHVLQTPDGSWTNWSIFRGMIHDKRRIVCLVGTGQHNSIIRDKWLKQGRHEMPWALAMGVPPAASLAAALPVPEGVSEAEYAGAMVGKPLSLVKCELNKALEGPFEDFLGLHFEGDRHMQPLFTVNAITHRDGAILPVSVPGRITDESQVTASLASAELLALCKEHGFPILDASAPLETMGTWCALKVDTEKLGQLGSSPADFCRTFGQTVYSNKSTMLVNRILLFGPDVDIYNFKDIMWALSTRCRPGQDEYIFEDVPSFPLTPYMSHGWGNVHRGGKAISDCLLRMEYDGQKGFSSVDFETSYPPEVQERVKSRWTQMGFDRV